jgi:hypothetical protein
MYSMRVKIPTETTKGNPPLIAIQKGIAAKGNTSHPEYRQFMYRMHFSLVRKESGISGTRTHSGSTAPGFYFRV